MKHDYFKVSCGDQYYYINLSQVVQVDIKTDDVDKDGRVYINFYFSSGKNTSFHMHLDNVKTLQMLLENDGYDSLNINDDDEDDWK